jgi:hypothetical protein
MTRRITVRLADDVFAALAAAARQREVSPEALLTEAVEEKLARIQPRPRVGVGRSVDARSAAEETASPVAELPS